MFSKLAITATLVALTSSLPEELSVQKGKGKSFVVIGDFGNLRNLGKANMVFDGIAKMKKEAKSGSLEDFDFFATVGDNIYANQNKYPTDKEKDLFMGLWNKRDSIKKLPIYPVRGNHDCYSDMMYEVNMSKKYSNWQMPTWYYDKQFTVGPNGEKFSLYAIDSCFLLCQSVA